MADLPLGQIVRSNRHRAADWQGSAGALHWMGSNPAKLQKKRRDTRRRLFLAEDEGFEPPQTESESGVLPLHKSSMALFRLPRHKQHGYYSTEKENVKHYFPFLKEFFLLRQYPLWEKKICTQKERK